MAKGRRREHLIRQLTETDIKRLKKAYQRGYINGNELKRCTLEDPRMWDRFLQHRVSDDNICDVDGLSNSDWEELKLRLSPGDEWWYAADTTLTTGWGCLVRLVDGNVVEQTNLLWKS